MSLAKIKALAERHEVEFDYSREGRTYSLECWAPDGQVWSATGTHFYALAGDGHCTTPDWKQTLTDLQGAITYGFEDCVDEECDVCNPE